jgi:hypothetical protein
MEKIGAAHNYIGLVRRDFSYVEISGELNFYLTGEVSRYSLDMRFL